MKNHKLPTGEYTEDTELYCNEWMELGKAIERVLGCYVFAYDPDVAICPSITQTYPSASLPMWVAKKIAALDEPEGEVPQPDPLPAPTGPGWWWAFGDNGRMEPHFISETMWTAQMGLRHHWHKSFVKLTPPEVKP